MKDRCVRPSPFFLSVTGTLIVVVALLLPGAKAQSVVEGASVGDIFTGIAVSGTLEAGDPTLADGSYFETWAYTLDGPGFISIDLNSTDFDTYVFLALPDDTIIGENDDCVVDDFTRSCIQNLPAVAGTYYVGVNTFSSGETGDYTAQVSFTALTLIPEPSTLVLTGVGIMGLLRRRR
jgi:hypothetical protein